MKNVQQIKISATRFSVCWLAILMVGGVAVNLLAKSDQPASQLFDMQKKEAPSKKAALQGPVVSQKDLENMCRIFAQQPGQMHDFSTTGDNFLFILGCMRQQKPADFYTYLRWLFNATKQCQSLQVNSFKHILSGLQVSMEPFLDEAPLWLYEQLPTTSLWMEGALLDRFTDYFQSDNRDLCGFLSTLANQLSYQLQVKIQHQEEEIYDLTLLRQLALRFVETAAGKLVWKETSLPEAWNQLVAVSAGVVALAKSGIIVDQDSMGDIAWSLVYRFVHFLDHVVDQPVGRWEELLQNLISGELEFLLKLDQGLDAVNSKKEVLLQALHRGRAKALQQEKDEEARRKQEDED